VNQVHPAAQTTIRFVEFMGLPGSGKSTIAAFLAADLKRSGIKAISQFADHAPFFWRHGKRLLRIARNAGRIYPLYLDAFRLIRASGQKSHLDRAKVTWNLWNVIAVIADCRAAGNAVTIVDQGLFQAIWSIQLSSTKEISTDAWTAFLRSVDVSDMLVVSVRSEIRVASNRLFKRAFKLTRLSSQVSGGYAETWRAAAANLVDLACLAHAVLPPDPLGKRIITVDNSAADPQTAASEVALAFLARTGPLQPSTFRDLCWEI
jgi:AAA domain